MIILKDKIYVNYDVIILTETWFDDSIKDSDFCLRNYKIYRNDTCKKSSEKNKGNGAPIAVHSNISNSLVLSSNHIFEQLYNKFFN